MQENSFVQENSNSSVEGQRTVARFTLRSFCCSFVRFIVLTCSTLPFISTSFKVYYRMLQLYVGD